jgi:hypothetical protein
MKLYLSGPITGVNRYRSKFAKFEKQLREMGHTVINPAVETEGLNPADYLLISFARLQAADAIVLLPNWWDSEGAKIEAAYAKYAKKRIFQALYPDARDGGIVEVLQFYDLWSEYQTLTFDRLHSIGRGDEKNEH